MRFQFTLAAALAASATAYPGMAGAKEDMLDYIKAETIKREAAPGTDTVIGGLLGTIDGLLGSVASSVDPSNKRPEPGFTFIAPGKNDSRGPCPGLNLLANYGYLPRNGLVTFGEVLNATARGFNMGADLAAVLCIFAILTDGDIPSESFYLGTNPVTGVGGLNRHSTVEADISPNREDYYNGCGDDHHLSSRLFAQNVNIVGQSLSKQFDIINMGTQYATSATFSKTYNPTLYFFPFPLIVSTAAFAFYPQFFSNGTYGAGGVANYESISSIIGAQYDSKKNAFEYVPEKWPTNWYRRATEYDAVTALTQGIVDIYLRNIVTPGLSQFGTPNFNVTNTICDVYQGLNSITPLALAGEVQYAAEGISWALSKLDIYFKDTVAGCSHSAISPNYFYPNQTQLGGPRNPPPSVTSNTGNNVYNKIYFTSAPYKPQCSHAYSP